MTDAQIKDSLKYLHRVDSERNIRILKSEVYSFEADKDYYPHNADQWFAYMDHNKVKNLLD